MINKIQAAKNIAELQGIFYNSFAVYGTALGSLRENGVIGHDLDTDLGMLLENFDWSQLKVALQKGYRIIEMYGMKHYGMEIALGKEGVKTDLMFFYADKNNPDKVFNCLWQNGGRNGTSDAIIHEYDRSMLAIVPGMLEGLKIRTLGEEYIIHVYGPDWKTPVEKWDWKTDHKCIKK